MVKDLVRLYNDEVRAGTFLISKGFNRDHFKLMRLVEKYKDRFLRLENKRLSKSLIMQNVSAKKAGRPIKEYLLTEGQVIFLGTLFRNTNDAILDFKETIAREFVALKKQNDALKEHQSTEKYQITRDAGKILRSEATDTMKEFVEYARFQGSKKPENYYMLYTKMVNGLLFIVEGKFKNLREVMSTPQLMTTATAENVIIKGISEGMKKKVFYKDIYKDVKSRVMTFADLTGQSKVIEEHLLIE